MSTQSRHLFSLCLHPPVAHPVCPVVLAEGQLTPSCFYIHVVPVEKGYGVKTTQDVDMDVEVAIEMQDSGVFSLLPCCNTSIQKKVFTADVLEKMH